MSSFCCCRSNKYAKGDESSDLQILTENEENTTCGKSKLVDLRKTGSTLVAKYNYTSPQKDCIQVIKSKRFTIIDDSDLDWKLVKNEETNDIGYAPSNLFVEESNLNNHEWYFENSSKLEVERNLLLPHHEIGTFLIRKSTKPHCFPFVISVRYDDSIKRTHVKHYKIFRNSKNNFYISEGLEFSTLAELVKVYQDNNLLHTRLKKPCELPNPIIGTLSPFHKNWEIPKEEILIAEDRQLGNGQFSRVFHGIWMATTEVAVKVLNDDCNIEQVFNEIKIMKTLKHKNLVQLYGVSLLTKPHWIVEEYMPYGSLLSFIRRTDLSSELDVFIAYQVTDGMAYLDSNNIIHRDLAARNILIGENQVIKIADFGLSRKTDFQGVYVPTRDTKLPIRWMAPEIFSNSEYTKESDVWSFGILVIELYTNGQLPYRPFTNFEVLAKVLKGYRIRKPQKMPDNVYTIVCRCWEEDPKKRPTFAQLKLNLMAILIAWEESGDGKSN